MEINKDLIILHCTTNYPCPIEDVNLRVMKTIRDETGCIVGYSDHTEGIDIPIMAVSLGALVIEKHFTLDRSMPGPDHKASLDPRELKGMIDAIRDKKTLDIPETILGSGIKAPTQAELKLKQNVRKSIMARCAISKGTTITGEMLCIKRPERGILPKHFDKIVGMEASEDIEPDEMITWDKLKKDGE